MQGKIFVEQSSSGNKSTVAARAIKAAFRACTNGSRSDLENAAVRTLVLVYKELVAYVFHRLNIILTPVPRFLAIFPRQIVVFVRMPGCSSFAVLARYRRSSPFMIRSDNFGTTMRTAFTVCSRIKGAKSVNPVTFAVNRHL